MDLYLYTHTHTLSLGIYIYRRRILSSHHLPTRLFVCKLLPPPPPPPLSPLSEIKRRRKNTIKEKNKDGAI